jgi:Domain of unknown function (DUF4157)/Novel toxin 15
MLEEQQLKPGSTSGSRVSRPPAFTFAPAHALPQPTLAPLFTPQLQRQAVAAQGLAAHTLRPVALQRQQLSPVLEALSLQRQVTEDLSVQREALRAQIGPMQTNLPPGVAQAALQEAALQRQAAGQRPVAALSRPPQAPAEWVQAAQLELQRVADPATPGGTRWMGTAERERHIGTLRGAGQGLARGFKNDHGPAAQRYAEYGESLATLQRQPLTAGVSRLVMSQVSPAERPHLQRAVDAALQRQQEQDEQDRSALHLHALQRQLAELDEQAGQPLTARIQARRGSGSPLPEAVRRQLEHGLNSDLSRVRLHTDTEADALSKGVQAVAFTTGQDIFFRAGTFDPNTKSGIELLAHEVTHTVQQGQGKVGGGIDPDAGLEGEARSFGHRFAAGQIAGDLSRKAVPQHKALEPAGNPHAPGVYTKQAALGRVQQGAVQAALHNPFTSLQRLHDGTIQRNWLGDAWDATGGKVVSAVADKGKELVSSGLKLIPGYKELCMTFGKDLVTGKAMAQNPNAILDALANWLPGPLKDIIKAVRESGALPKAWAWFQGELKKLNLGGLLGEVGSAIKSASLSKAKAAVMGRVSTLKGIITGSAKRIADIVLTAISAGLGPVGAKIMAGLRQSGDVVVQVLKNPAKFAGNLLNALKQGFGQFGQNAGKHFQNGVAGWLTGATGVQLPPKFDLPGIFMTALTIMGLTYQNFRGRLVKAVGEQKVKLGEGSLSMLQTLKGGLHKDPGMKGNQGGVGADILTGIKGEVQNSLIIAGIKKVVGMLIPGGGFLTAILGAFQSVQFLIQRGAQIAGVIMDAFNSVGAIAAGNISGAAGLIERSLAGSIPLALDFVSRLVGIGNLGGKIKAIITRARSKLNGFVDKIVLKVKGLLGKMKTGASNTVAKAKTFVSGIFGKKSFTTKKEQHSVWVDANNGNPTMWIASTPREARVQLRYAHTEAVHKNKDKKSEADRYLSQGQTIISKGISDLTKASTAIVGKTDPKVYFASMAAKHSALLIPIAQKLFELAEEGESGQGSVLPPHTVTFQCKPSLDFDEYKRQINISQAALRGLSAEEFFKRRAQFKYVVPLEKVERGLKNTDGRDDYHETRAMTIARKAAEQELTDFLLAGSLNSDVMKIKIEKIERLLLILKIGIDNQKTIVKDPKKRVRLSSQLSQVEDDLSKIQNQANQPNLSRAKVAAKSILSSLAILHSLDQVAAGSPTGLTGEGLNAYGDARVDFSIGASWNKQKRLSNLEDHIRKNIGLKFYSATKLSPISLEVVKVVKQERR